MRQTIKKFLWVGWLGVQPPIRLGIFLVGAERGISRRSQHLWRRLGARYIGFNPIDSYNGGAPPYLGFDTLAIGPKNIGEGYRRNTPVIYYSFDQNFAGFFGVNGEQAVDGAIAILNSAFTNNPATGQYLTNGVDSFSPDLLEYPLQSQSENYSAAAVGLLDLKSVTLAVMMEQLGLADSIRYTWILHNRYQNPGTTAPCPAGYVYLVTLRNFDIIASSLSELQYSAYVNNGLYSYSIPDDCGAAGSTRRRMPTRLKYPLIPWSIIHRSRPAGKWPRVHWRTDFFTPA